MIAAWNGSWRRRSCIGHYRGHTLRFRAARAVRRGAISQRPRLRHLAPTWQAPTPTTPQFAPRARSVQRALRRRRRRRRRRQLHRGALGARSSPCAPAMSLRAGRQLFGGRAELRIDLFDSQAGFCAMNVATRCLVSSISLAGPLGALARRRRALRRSVLSPATWACDSDHRGFSRQRGDRGDELGIDSVKCCTSLMIRRIQTRIRSRFGSPLGDRFESKLVTASRFRSHRELPHLTSAGRPEQT